MLFMTSLLGTIVGLLVFYQLLSEMIDHIGLELKIRLVMGNSMAFAFTLSMFLNMVTGSKWISVSVTLIVISIAAYLLYKPNKLIDMIEVVLSAIMSAAMGVMLFGMVNMVAVFMIQVALLVVECLMLLMASGVLREKSSISRD